MRRFAPLVLVLACATARAEKRRETAQLLSGGGAGVSSALVLAGFMLASNGEVVNQPLFYAGLGSSLVTPALGEWYAGEWFTPGMAIRIAAGGLATFALRHEQTTVTCDTATSSDQKCNQLTGGGIALLGVAAIAYVGGVWYDALDAGDAVDRYNQRHGFTVTPTVVPGPAGAAPGVSLAGYF